MSSVPPHTRDRTVSVVAWVLAVASWVFPVGVIAAALFGALWWFQRHTGRVPLAACGVAAVGLAGQVMLWGSVT